jgi:hypothetical protein
MRGRPWGQHVPVHRRLRPLRLAAALVVGAAACGCATHEAATAEHGVASAKDSPSSALATTPPSAGKRGAAAVGARRSRTAAPVRAPVFRRRVDPGQTGWFASPSLVDLNRDGKLEIVAPMYSTYVFSGNGRRLATGTASAGRVYAPSVVADLDHDGTKDIVVGGTGSVVAYEWRRGRLVVKPGWPASVASGGQTPEVRGLAAGDLLGDGRIEVVATTTNTSPTGSQVFVFDARGRLFQPTHGHRPAWPRYNQLRGAGNDRDFNGQGNTGYGGYGLNVGIGHLEDGRQQDIVVTYDNHQINVFRPDGTSVLASRWYTNPSSQYLGRRLGWGQFIRWLDPKVEDAHLHAHGIWPSVRRIPWLQWTASPPSIADLDNDGRNEVVGVPNVEEHEPYQTQAHAVMVLDSAQGGGARSGRRHPGFTTLPLTGKPLPRAPGDWYPPDGVPAPTLVDLTGDAKKDIVFPGNDGYVYAVSSNGKRLWRHGYAPGRARTFASEVVAADLNRDGVPELVFGVYGLKPGSGRLVVLTAAGKLVSDRRLPNQRTNGNGVGIGAAPSVGDLDGDGTLEIVTLSIDHGLDIFTVPGSKAGVAPWPTGRGGLLRAGTPRTTAGR